MLSVSSSSTLVDVLDPVVEAVLVVVAEELVVEVLIVG
jgi:hypothetical protein